MQTVLDNGVIVELPVDLEEFIDSAQIRLQEKQEEVEAASYLVKGLVNISNGTTSEFRGDTIISLFDLDDDQMPATYVDPYGFNPVSRLNEEAQPIKMALAELSVMTGLSIESFGFYVESDQNVDSSVRDKCCFVIKQDD